MKNTSGTNLLVKCYDLLRIFLGVALCAKGVAFATDPSLLNFWFMQSKVQFLNSGLGHYVVLAHICGGILLALGLVTRWAAISQIPILLVAVFLIHSNQGLFSYAQNLELAVLVLWMLILYAISGAGPYSLDAYLQSKSHSKSK